MAPAITITSEELRERVEEHLGRWIPDSLWERSEPYARRKLDLCRERSPEIDYYNDEYLVLLTADTVRETAFSDYTLAACEAIMAARTIQDAVAEQEAMLAGSGRVLVRPSGTEALIRVMVEASSQTDAQKIAEHLANVIKKY